MVTESHILIITLNVNGLNAPTKRHRMAGEYKNKTHIYCLQEIHFIPTDTYRLKVRTWEKVSHANGNYKKVGAATLK